MPYFPKENESITLTLKMGGTVTLVERIISQGERKALRKKMITTEYDFKFREKQGREIDRKAEEAGLDKNAHEAAGEEAAILFDNMADALLSVYATVLAARFQTWDVFASKADMEANKPVPMERDAIIAFMEVDPRNSVFIEHVMEALRKHDGVEEKKEQSEPAAIGSSSTVKTAS